MKNITINSKKRGTFMKKIVAILLAIISVFAMSIPAFAAEDVTAKDVDNTFDNFTPAPGKTAPENWYDPYCYDEDGHINKYAVNYGGTVYCPTAKKIFTSSEMGRTNYKPDSLKLEEYKYDWFAPYNTIIPIVGHQATTEWICYYCPYCGLREYDFIDAEDSSKTVTVAALTHNEIEPVVYGWYCNECGDFSAHRQIVEITDSFSFETWEGYLFNRIDHCTHIQDLNEVKLYRFLTEEQRTAEYSFIFTETEEQFGDGVDGKIEDLETDKYGNAIGWNKDGKPQEATFGDKIANFFKSIGDFFASIAAWFQKLFGIVK